MKKLLSVALNTPILKNADTISRKSWELLSPVLDTEDDFDILRAWANENLLANDAETVDYALENLSSLEKTLSAYEQNGIFVLNVKDEDYPQKMLQKLGSKSPIVLFYTGNPKLLNAEKAIGIVGSRDVDSYGAEFTKEIAKLHAEADYVIVSGAARGVDSEAMRSAYDSGGSTVGYLSDGLAKLRKSSDFLDLIESGRFCGVSNVLPNMGFTIANAMGRNKYIYASSDAVVVISSSAGTGGTWAGAKECLKANWTPVFVRDSDNAPDGNKELIKMGGISLCEPKLLTESDITQDNSPAPKSQTQQSLF